MLLDVGPEGTVGLVDIVVRACMQGDGKLSGGDAKRGLQRARGILLGAGGQSGGVTVVTHEDCVE